jgi:hypothetical protein
MFYGPTDLPVDLVERLSKNKAAALGAVMTETNVGWVTGRHLLDTNLTADSIRYAGYLRVVLRQAVRAVPAEILAAECRMEEIAAAAVTGGDIVNRRKRAEIRKAIVERMLPTQTPRLRGIPLVHNEVSDIWYVGASTESQADALVMFAELAGIRLIPITVETLAIRIENKEIGEIAPIAYSAVPAAELCPGGDFLTWLWFVSEVNHGVIKIGGASSDAIGVLVEGPLLFAGSGGAVESVTLSKGCPTQSNEANTALATGKRLVRAKITLAIADEIWSCRFDARSFAVSGLSVPAEGGHLDDVSRFQDRMLKIQEFGEFLRGIFSVYLKSRISPQWPEYEQNMAAWAANRKGRP